MPTHVVFCSACDHNVSLVPRSPEWTWHIVLDNRLYGDVACLDQGHRCTGALCPFSAESATRAEVEEALHPGIVPPN